MSIIAALLFISCEKEKKQDEEGIPINTKGIYVINEGGFQQSTGDVTLMNVEGMTYPSLFKLINHRPLGDIFQSLCVINNTGYLLVNNSQKIEVVSMSDFRSVGVINGISGPRFMLKINNAKAYVSDWGSNSVKIIDLSNNSISGSIPTGSGPETMIMQNNKVYVTNVGGFGNDSTVTIINPGSDQVIKTLMVGLNPNSICADTNGMIHVLCSGTVGPDWVASTADDIGGKLLTIDPSNDSIISTYDFAQFEHPVKMSINASGDKLYYLLGISNTTGKITELDIHALPPGNILVNREFYGLGIDPSKAAIYGSTPAFTSNSYVLHYKTDGSFIDSVEAGIGANGFYFYY